MDKRPTGIMAWFTYNPVASNLLMIFLIIGGLFSALTINKEVFPALRLNFVHVNVVYPGAAPEDIEENIIIKIEEEIKDLNGIHNVTSTATEGSALIRIEAEDDYDIKELLDEVKLKIDAISTFPDGVEKPNIYRIEAESPVLWLSVYGNLRKQELKEMTKQIREEINALPEVTRTKLQGAPDYEIGIEVSEEKLREYNLTFEEVAVSVRKNSLDLPGGTIQAIEGNILLRAKGQAYTGKDFSKILLKANDDGSRILLKDVAEINDGFKEGVDYVAFNRQPAMVIQVNSVDGQNALIISQKINDYVEEKKKTLPTGVSIDIWGDLTYYLEGRLNMMLENMYSGAFLVFLILALFLQLKLAFWVIIGLPVCFLGTLLVMPQDPFNLSINVLTLFAFILVLGIVVDDAIIIGESCFTEIEKNGHSRINVLNGAYRVAMPATFGVLTTIAAFMPMVLVTGTVAIIWQSIALVVIFCLIFSLIESKWILPSHLAEMNMKPPPAIFQPITSAKENFNTQFKSFIQTKYRDFLTRCLKRKYTVLATFIALMVISIGLIVGGKVRWVFFPNLPQDIIEVRLSMDDSSSEMNTYQAITKIEQALYDMDNQVNNDYGEYVIKHSFVAMTSSTEAVMVIELTKGEERGIDAFEITKLWRDKIPPISGIKEFDIRSSMNESDPIAFKIVSNNFEQLAKLSERIKEKLNQYYGVFDINDNFSSGGQEIKISLLPEGEILGLNLSDLAQQVRYAFYGYEAQRLLRNKEEVKVMVRYPLKERRSVGYLEKMRITTPQSEAVPLSTIAKIDIGQAYASITRVDNLRAITISADADKNKVEPTKIAYEILEEFKPIIEKEYPDVKMTLFGDSEDEGKTIVSLMQSASLSLLIIYALIAIPLKSYAQPFIIMSVIPFGLIGAVIGHLLQGLSINVLSLMGIVALAGVVVNDSLIMVDFVNKAKEEGLSIAEAAVESGCRRFRAIILTSLTTFFGLVPILFETSLQAKIVIPMATSLAFGIVFATCVTLILVPSLYLILEDIRHLFQSKKNHYKKHIPFKS